MPRYPLLADILAARQRLRGIALHTPLEASSVLAAESGAAEVFGELRERKNKS